MSNLLDLLFFYPRPRHHDHHVIFLGKNEVAAEEYTDYEKKAPKTLYIFLVSGSLLILIHFTLIFSDFFLTFLQRI